MSISTIRNGLKQGTNEVLPISQDENPAHTRIYYGEDLVYGDLQFEIGVVTEDLRCYVNANNITSYPGSGSTWFDISGNSRDLDVGGGTILFVTGSPNYFDFTDSSDPKTYAATYRPGDVITSLTSQNTYTVCMFYAYAVSSGYRTIIRSVNGSGTLRDFVLVDNGTENLGTFTDTFHGFGIDITTDIPDYDTQFNYQVYTQATGSGIAETEFFLNNSGSIGSNNDPMKGQGPAVFGNQETGDQPGALISAILVYDRVLTSAEITKNYNALKGEMGLG